MGDRHWAIGKGLGVVEVRSYRDLKVWQQGMDLASAAYQLTASMPKSERYGLTSQIRRSAASVPANIAEGYGRGSSGSYIQFLKTARGSLLELETHVLLAERIGILGTEQSGPFLISADNIGKMLSALIRSIQTNR